MLDVWKGCMYDKFRVVLFYCSRWHTLLFGTYPRWYRPVLWPCQIMVFSVCTYVRLMPLVIYVLLSYRWVAWSYEVPFFAPACSLHHCYQQAGLGWVTRRELAWCSPSQRMVTAPPRISELVLSVVLTTLSHAYFIFGVASWALIFLRTLRPHTLTLPSDIVSWPGLVLRLL